MARLPDLIVEGEDTGEGLEDYSDDDGTEEREVQREPFHAKRSRKTQSVIPEGGYAKYFPKELSPKGARELLLGYFREQVGQMRTYLRKAKTTGSTPEYESLKAWFDNDFYEGPFSFAGICSIFRWEPDYIRRKVYKSDPKKSYRSLGRGDNLEEKL